MKMVVTPSNGTYFVLLSEEIGPAALSKYYKLVLMNVKHPDSLSSHIFVGPEKGSRLPLGYICVGT
jgi:hypothetical protein